MVSAYSLMDIIDFYLVIKSNAIYNENDIHITKILTKTRRLEQEN